MEFMKGEKEQRIKAIREIGKESTELNDEQETNKIHMVNEFLQEGDERE